MSQIVDCRGLSCPEPVINSREALQNVADNIVTVLVSNAVARDNVSRTAKALGWHISTEQEGDDFKLTLTR